MTPIDDAGRGTVYWVVGALISANLALLGWSAVVLDGKADVNAIARLERSADEIDRRDRDYLARSQIEELVRSTSPYAVDKPRIEEQLRKLDAEVADNRGEVSDAARSLVRIETQVAQIRETLRSLDANLDEIVEALAGALAASKRE